MNRLVCIVLCTLVLPPAAVVAQQSPFLPEDVYNKLTNEISGDIAYDSLRSLVMYHSPTGGAADFQKEAQWVVERAKSYGLEDVHFIAMPQWHASPDSVDENWTLKGGELWLLSPKTMKLGDVRETPTSVADNSPTADLTADLVNVGEGTSETDYAGKDVAGKVVLAYGSPNRVKELACWARGAVGIVSYASTRVDPWLDHPDQIAWLRMAPSKPSEKPVPPVFVVSPRTGLMLSHWMTGAESSHIFSAGAAKPAEAPVFRVRLKVDSEVTRPGRQGMVEGFIRGTADHEHAIVLTAHLQEEKTSANDDRSGCANLLEIARALEAMISDGRLPRPRRDIRFWWTNEIGAEYEYFAEHPEESRRLIADVNQDMVGAKLSIGGRVQHVSLTPYSRWSFVDDVVENIVTSLVQGNNAYLASWQNQNPAPYSRPIFAHLGSREPYRAELVPYFDSTDHLVFNEAAIGVPGVTFTNWPDEYIHSSDDDLWQIDRTELQRNAVAVAAIALYLANLGEQDAPRLASVVAGGARVRLSRDLATGIARMGSASPADLPAAYQDALNLLEQAEQREVADVRSIEPYAVAGLRKLLAGLVEDLKLTEINHRGRLDEWYAALGGKKGSAGFTEREKALAAKVPKTNGALGEYLRKKELVDTPKGLHSLMAYEALNYVDGRRSVLDIYHAVRAESLSAGEWYYGTVTLEAIEELLQSAEKKGAILMSNNPS